MDELEEIKATFFQECDELLAELGAGTHGECAAGAESARTRDEDDFELTPAMASFESIAAASGFFGAAKKIETLHDVGSSNAAFAQRFLEDEGIAIVNARLGGRRARRIAFRPATTSNSPEERQARLATLRKTEPAQDAFGLSDLKRRLDGASPGVADRPGGLSGDVC